MDFEQRLDHHMDVLVVVGRLKGIQESLMILREEMNHLREWVDCCNRVGERGEAVRAIVEVGALMTLARLLLHKRDELIELLEQSKV